MLFGMTTCAVLWYSTGTVNISSDISDIAGSVVLLNMFSLVILNNPSISSNTSITSELYLTLKV